MGSSTPARPRSTAERPAAAVVVALLAGVSFAEYVVPGVGSRVEEADLIVVGILRDVTTETRDGYDLENGVIEVSSVLHGNASPGTSLRIQWKNEANVICPRTRHPEAEGRVALWLLERARKDVHAGRYPEYTLVLSEDNAALAEWLRELRTAGAARTLSRKGRRVLDFLDHEWGAVPAPRPID